jgi:hypothetical protein
MDMARAGKRFLHEDGLQESTASLRHLKYAMQKIDIYMLAPWKTACHAWNGEGSVEWMVMLPPSGGGLLQYYQVMDLPSYPLLMSDFVSRQISHCVKTKSGQRAL